MKAASFKSDANEPDRSLRVNHRHHRPKQPVEVVFGHRPQGIYAKIICYVDFAKCVVPKGSALSYDVSFNALDRSLG